MPTRTRFRKRRSTHAPKGFKFAEISTHEFDTHASFFDALARQRENRITLPGRALTKVGIDGNIGGDDGLRLTAEAFGALCKLSGVPAPFVKKLAKRDEALAMEILQDGIDHVFPAGDVALVVDADVNMVETIAAPGDEYPAEKVMELVDTANKSMQFVRGWLHGPAVRLTMVSPKEHTAQVGDIVQTGISAETTGGVSGRSSFTDYVERLSCSNGLTARDGSRMSIVPHSLGDELDDAMVSASIECGRRVTGLVPAMQQAARHFFDEKGVRTVRGYLAEARHGGGRSMEARATRGAVEEARRAGREEGEVTLWDFVNGTTEAAKQYGTLAKRRDAEALGYSLLPRVLGREICNA